MKILYIFGLMLWGSMSLAQDKIEFPNFVSYLLEDKQLTNASIAISIFDLSADTTLCAFNQNLSLPPASIQKIFTTAAALEILEPSFRYQTHLAYSGNLMPDGKLEGNIHIMGGGDPTLGSRYFDSDVSQVVNRWIRHLVRLNINEVTGHVIGDASYVEGLGVGESWPYIDLGNYYASGYYGLNIHDNLFTLMFQQNPDPGKPVKLINILPAIENLSIKNQVVSGGWGSGDQAYIYGAPFQFNRFVNGSIPPGNGIFNIKGSIPDPPLFTAQYLKTAMQSKQLSVHGMAKSKYQPDVGKSALRPIDTLQSSPLVDIVRITNQESVNLFAEAVGKTMAKSISPSKESGENILRSVWASRGISLEGCRFTDYCGLAPDNAITTRSVIDILRYIYQKKDLYALILPSLSKGGINGTMKYLFQASPAKGKIVGKSGLINGVRNYAGYVHLPDDRTLAFCIFSYNFSCSQQDMRKKLEQFLESLYLSYLKGS